MPGLLIHLLLFSSTFLHKQSATYLELRLKSLSQKWVQKRHFPKESGIGDNVFLAKGRKSAQPVQTSLLLLLQHNASSSHLVCYSHISVYVQKPQALGLTLLYPHMALAVQFWVYPPVLRVARDHVSLCKLGHASMTNANQDLADKGCQF